MRQVGYLQRLYRDARSTEHKNAYRILVGQKKKITTHFQDISLDVRKELKFILKLCDWDLKSIYVAQDCEKQQALLYAVTSI